MAAALRAMLAAAAFAIPAYAQVLTGTVRDSVAHLPLPGVVVALLDSSGAAVTRTLTNERGEYRALLTGPVRTVRAIRIGYGARALPIPPRTTGNVQIDFSLLALPTMIQAVHVLGDTRCPDRNDRAAAFGLWEQARAGLLATVVARETNPGSMVRLLFTRKYEPIENGRDRNRIASMTVRADSSVSTASFVAAHSVQDFVASGFASLGERVRTYFGPDAELLLSEQFATAYCLELAAPDRARKNQAGVRFLPAYQHDGTTNIDGTLWIDTLSRELREVDFSYLDLPTAAERSLHPGGYVSFRTMKNGVPLVDRWSLRVAFNDVPFRQLAWRITEVGGELARATWTNAGAWTAPLGAVRIRLVTNSGAPRPGVGVSLFPSYYFGTTDADGTVEIKDLLPGPYAVTIGDPRLAELGIGAPAHFSFTAARDSTVNATIKIPSTDALIRDHRPDPRHLTARDSALIVGRVVSQDGSPVAGARVTFAARHGDSWEWRSDYVVTGDDGVFQSCRDWRIGDDARINVHQDGLSDFVMMRRFESSVLAAKIFVDSKEK